MLRHRLLMRLALAVLAYMFVVSAMQITGPAVPPPHPLATATLS